SPFCGASGASLRIRRWTDAEASARRNASAMSARPDASSVRSVAAKPQAPRWITRKPTPRSDARVTDSTAPSFRSTASRCRSILQAILQKAAEFGPVRVKLAIFGQEVASQDDTLLMALEFTGIEPIAVAQRMSGRLLKGRSDAVLITRALKLLYKDRPDLEVWFVVSGDRDLNALCKAIKDEDKKVYLVAGDQSLANELRDSPYLRDGVFLPEVLIPEAPWTRGWRRRDHPQLGKGARPREGRTSALRTRRGGRGRGRGTKPPAVP